MVAQCAGGPPSGTQAARPIRGVRILSALPVPSLVRPAPRGIDALWPLCLSLAHHRRQGLPAHEIDALLGGLLSQGEGGLIPCTPLGCLKIIKSIVGDLTGSHAVVIGSSNIVGKPMAALLLEERATVTQTHIHTRDTQFICRGADILVSAVGKPGLVRGDWIKPRAIVIDVGTTRVARPDGKYGIVGDVDFEEARLVAGAITPVPGGVGPMTIAMLMANTVIAAYRKAGRTAPKF